jgi:ribonuclease HII
MDRLDENQVGLDEVGRGCFAGPVVTAAVLWDSNWLVENKDIYPELEWIKDSKKLSKKKIKLCEEFIKIHSVSFTISFVDADTIDNINILNATYKGMHNSLDDLSKMYIIDRILVDGNTFKNYKNINKNSSYFIVPHYCIPGGDNVYINIASASILAKVARDEYIIDLCKQFPEYQSKYDWENNKGYGTKKHILGIETWGICGYHRKTFGICKRYV